MSRTLEYLMIHCTATPEGRALTGEDIRRMHCSPKRKGGRGWKVPGYSDVIRVDGTIDNLVPYDGDGIVQPREITNGAVGLNGKTRHVSYVGGVDVKGKPKDTRTEAQLHALEVYVLNFLSLHPDAKVLGHNQVAAKACPSFDAPTWLLWIGVAPRNIYG